MAKARPDRVHPEAARRALELAGDAQGAYSQYIKLHFRSTGRLAPGCDNRDLIAWYKENEPEAYQAKGGK